ncbi:hypothetical protein VTO42DRAFT_4206 [Malbranchea cinnamomea]
MSVTMLSSRTSLRSLQRSCKCFSSILSRAYATEAQIPTTTQSADVPIEVPVAPPPTTKKGGVQLRSYKPRTPGLRHLKRPINDHLWKGRPIISLTFPKKGHGKGGRNHTGRVTVRHRGGGHKRRIRIVDFERWAPGPHVVQRIERDPGRTAHIALVKSEQTGKLSYILAAEGMRAGDVVESYRSGIPEHLWESMGRSVDPGVLAAKTAWRGNCLPLNMIPVGTLIFNVGLHKDKGGQLCRSAGTYATVIAKAGEVPKDLPLSMKTKKNVKQEGEGENTEDGNAAEEEGNTALAKTESSDPPMTEQEWRKLKKLSDHVAIRLQSGEIRLIHKDCCATIGVASNGDHQYRQLGKAGRKRWLNIRPTVRGVAMNAKDHPHGGGRGKSKGNVHPKSPWGRPAKSGFKTRPVRHVNKDVLVPRPRNHGKRRRGYS